MMRWPSIYIDGGVQLFRTNQTKWLGFNKYIYGIPMDKSWNAISNYSETRTARFMANETGANPPNMLRGGLYAALYEDNRLFTFGGSTFLANTTDPDWTPPRQDEASLWSFDILSRAWEQYDISSVVPRRPNWGAVAEDVNHEFGFFLNGQFDRGSSLGRYESVEYKGGTATNSTYDQITYLSGMIVLDLRRASPRNVSTDSLGAPRVAGGLVYTPYFGRSPNGTLIAFGGMRSRGEGDDTFTNGILIDFTTVSLCDNFGDENVTWFNQSTTGETPSPRIDFCTFPGESTVPDNSSFNFYIYGGYDPKASIVYDDVYILSLPSFTWTKAYSGGARDGNLFAVETTGSVLNFSNSTCDEGPGVSLFDMTDLAWSTFLNASAAPYQIPDKVVQKIGGS
ncbi:hypothetical protein MPH_13412 [Macrophomina phaseolina MS6]|uniref:Galactose oxidase/kelch beta-propeller n=1 Tax=Macrophomina phaseolina (strain MS6) TaxID=1126212 RepID=K2R9Q5_MACPH|nr:hypothetical protein MPH_13412 [Macrophomina phaseolina MS6]